MEILTGLMWALPGVYILIGIPFAFGLWHDLLYNPERRKLFEDGKQKIDEHLKKSGMEPIDRDFLLKFLVISRCLTWVTYLFVFIFNKLTGKFDKDK